MKKEIISLLASVTVSSLSIFVGSVLKDKENTEFVKTTYADTKTITLTSEHKITLEEVGFNITGNRQISLEDQAYLDTSVEGLSFSFDNASKNYLELSDGEINSSEITITIGIKGLTSFKIDGEYDGFSSTLSNFKSYYYQNGNYIEDSGAVQNFELNREYIVSGNEYNTDRVTFDIYLFKELTISSITLKYTCASNNF